MKYFSRFRKLKSYAAGEEATAAVEAAFLFPLMVFFLCGLVDMGVALVTNMKVTNSTQIISDLLARDTTVTTAMINDSIAAGRLAIQPYNVATYGVDIAGVKYIGVTKVPTVQWRTTVNMQPNLDIIQHSAGLGDQNEGVIAVSVRYVYTPYFGEFITGVIVMEEEAYVRGRKGGFISKV